MGSPKNEKKFAPLREETFVNGAEINAARKKEGLRQRDAK